MSIELTGYVQFCGDGDVDWSFSEVDRRDCKNASDLTMQWILDSSYIVAIF